MARIAALVLTHADPRDTLACVDALLAQTRPLDDLIVVDNGSSPADAESLRAGLPTQARVLATRKNLGVAGGRNEGMREALLRGAEYVLVVDNDALASPDALAPLLDALERDPSAAAALPRYLVTERPDWEHVADVRFHPWLVHPRGGGARPLLRDERGTARPTEVDWVPGIASLVRASAWRDVGPWDEQFNPYGPEDADWGLRARARGYRLLRVPSATVRHPDTSISRDRLTKTRLQARGRVRFLRKHAHGARAASGAAFLLFDLLVRQPARARGTLPLIAYYAAVLGGLGEGLVRTRPESAPSRSD
jgi:GT2 family glycosyltransferase